VEEAEAEKERMQRARTRYVRGADEGRAGSTRDEATDDRSDLSERASEAERGADFQEWDRSVGTGA